jgi:hypothetical protein
MVEIDITVSERHYISIFMDVIRLLYYMTHEDNNYFCKVNHAANVTQQTQFPCS